MDAPANRIFRRPLEAIDPASLVKCFRRTAQVNTGRVPPSIFQQLKQVYGRLEDKLSTKSLFFILFYTLKIRRNLNVSAFGQQTLLADFVPQVLHRLERPHLWQTIELPQLCQFCELVANYQVYNPVFLTNVIHELQTPPNVKRLTSRELGFVVKGAELHGALLEIWAIVGLILLFGTRVPSRWKTRRNPRITGNAPRLRKFLGAHLHLHWDLVIFAKTGKLHPKKLRAFR